MRRFPTMTDKVCAFTFFLFLRFYWGFSFFTYFLQTMIKSATTNNVSPSPRLFLLTTKKKRPIFFFFFFFCGVTICNSQKGMWEFTEIFPRGRGISDASLVLPISSGSLLLVWIQSSSHNEKTQTSFTISLFTFSSLRKWKL